MNTICINAEVLRAAALRLPRLPCVPSIDGPILLAVSGGADSVYMLCALWADDAVRQRLCVAHLDHGVRGSDSAEDARFVASICAALEVPCRVGIRMSKNRSNSEAELRAAREDFFAHQRTINAAQLLCTAHHLDDVVETVLLRLARGAGLSGLSAPRVIQRYRDGHQRWRPLIAAGLCKRQILASLKALEIPWREDATNVMPIAKRNRIRAWLANGADEALGKDYAKGFAHSAKIIGEAQEAVKHWGRELGCIKETDGSLPVSMLQGRPKSLIQECLRAYFHEQELGDPRSEALADLVATIQVGGQLRTEMCGRMFTLKDGKFSIQPDLRTRLGTDVRPLFMDLMDNESLLLLQTAQLDKPLWEKLERGEISPTKTVYFAYSVGALTWRGRKQGDRYRPLGSPGVAKLSDLMINRKIPSEIRDSLPVVLAGSEIIWMPGLPLSESAKLDGPTQNALRLTWHGSILDILPNS